MSFRLPLDEHASHAPVDGVELSPSRALIVHPLAQQGQPGALSPEARAAADWLRTNCNIQTIVDAGAQPDAEVLLSSQPLSLLDFTCDENVRAIMSFLDGASLCAARSVNRHWRELAADDRFWFNLCVAEFHVSPTQLRTRPESYQKLYQYACRSLRMLIRDFFEEQCVSSLQSSFRLPRDAAMMLMSSRAAV